MTDTAEPCWHTSTGPLEHAGPAGILGIVNLTPDSFFAKSRCEAAEDAVARALRLLEEGADVIDLGAESSRPGAEPVSPETELERLLPVIDGIRARAPQATLSVDTYHAKTAACVLDHGVQIVNDISACSFDPELLDVLVQYRPGYVLMHCQGRPENMQDHPTYTHVVQEVTDFFEQKLARLVRAGVPENRVVLDPGIGFGKRMEHNLALMAHPEAWAHLGRPSLMACSMKSVFGDLLQRPTDDRACATQVATALTCTRGYHWHRVHHVAETTRTLRLVHALSRGFPHA